MSGSAFAVTHHAFSSGAGRTSDGNGSHASTLKSPSYTKSVSWQHHLARVGGEEFGVLLTEIDTECAKALAERIRENVERLTGDNPEYAIPQKVTISIGAVVTQKNELNPKEIYQLADNALYEAKETGRNKVVVKEAEILINRKDDE